MKKVLLIVVFLIVGSIQAQEINWMTMNEALAAQKKTPKKIIMDVYTKWCGPCKLMDKNTFSNKKVIDYINDFTYTNPNYQEGRKGRNATHFFADALKLRGYPSIVFFKDDGELIQAIPGYKSPQQLEIYLKMIASNDYLEVVTAEAWQDYQENFKSTFKE